MHPYAPACGLYCGACSSMLLHERESGAADAANYIHEYNDGPCPGCVGGAQECEFIRCARAKGVSGCAACDEFPCSMITKFSKDEWPHHIEVIDNLKRISEIGEEAWLDEQADRWSCPDCGARIHWYQKVCTLCGAGITNAY